MEWDKDEAKSSDMIDQRGAGDPAGGLGGLGDVLGGALGGAGGGAGGGGLGGVLGGMFGGKGRMVNAVLGGLVLALIPNGLTLVGKREPFGWEVDFGSSGVKFMAAGLALLLAATRPGGPGSIGGALDRRSRVPALPSA